MSGKIGLRVIRQVNASGGTVLEAVKELRDSGMFTLKTAVES
jgi:hypothetical protein